MAQEAKLCVMPGEGGKALRHARGQEETLGVMPGEGLRIGIYLDL